MDAHKITRLVRIVTSTHINGYSDEAAMQKEEFISLCRSYLRMIANKMGLPAGSYDIRVNRAGVAVSGDVHLHTDTLYVAFEQSCLGNDFGFMYRSCKGRKDYTGGQNRWMRWENLLSIPNVVKAFQEAAASGK